MSVFKLYLEDVTTCWLFNLFSEISGLAVYFQPILSSPMYIMEDLTMWECAAAEVIGLQPELPPFAGFSLVLSLLIAMPIWMSNSWLGYFSVNGFRYLRFIAILSSVFIFVTQSASNNLWLFVCGPTADTALRAYTILFGLFIFVFFTWYAYVTTTRYLSTIIFDLAVVFVLIFMFGTAMLFSRNFLWMFVAMVGLNILLYIALALPKTSGALESSAKYFSLGLVATVFMLLGILLVYSEYGTLHFFNIYGLQALADINGLRAPTVLEVSGVVFLILGLVFKLSAFPHSIWPADVYEGAALPVLWVLTASKMIVFIVLISVIQLFSFFNISFIGPVLGICAIGSMFVGTFGALLQQKAKRFFAYSSINHIGFVLAAASVEFNCYAVSILYLVVYLFGGFVFLTSVIGARRGDGSSGFVYLSDLAQIGLKSPIAALSIIASTFSLAGIPPFVGFFTKFSVLVALFNSGTWWGLLSFFFAMFLMTFAVFNYLRVLKTMMFKFDFNTYAPISVNTGGPVFESAFEYFICSLIFLPLAVIYWDGFDFVLNAF